jgi:hypothetical protein
LNTKAANVKDANKHFHMSPLISTTTTPNKNSFHYLNGTWVERWKIYNKKLTRPTYSVRVVTALFTTRKNHGS